MINVYIQILVCIYRALTVEVSATGISSKFTLFEADFS